MPLWNQDWIHIFKKQKIDDYAQAHKEQVSKHGCNRIAEMGAGAPILAHAASWKCQFLQLLQSQMQQNGLLLYLVRKKMITPDITAIPMNFSLSLRKSS